MKKDVLLIAPTMNTIDDKATDRFTYLARLLVERGAEVELITSDFNHRKKEYRTREGFESFPFKITLIHEKKYTKNISIKRIIGHSVFAKGVIKYLKKRKKPDVIYVAYPSSANAYRVSRFCLKHNIPYLIDIQDLWPEAFSIVLGDNFISKLIINSLKRKPNFAYKNATFVFSVSKTYTERALQVNKNYRVADYVFLGNDKVDTSTIDLGNSVDLSKNTYKIVYVGNFGKSYDFLNLFKALNLLEQKGIKDLELIMIGDGVQSDYLRELSQQYFSNVQFTGFLEYGKLIKACESCDLGVNPIVKKSVSSVINKVGDYAQAGIPVVNSQVSIEYRNLVEEYKCGLNANCEDYVDIANKILYLYNNKDLGTKMGLNNKKLFTDHFDRSINYKKIVECLLMGE